MQHDLLTATDSRLLRGLILGLNGRELAADLGMTEQQVRARCDEVLRRIARSSSSMSLANLL